MPSDAQRSLKLFSSKGASLPGKRSEFAGGTIGNARHCSFKRSPSYLQMMSVHFWRRTSHATFCSPPVIGSIASFWCPDAFFGLRGAALADGGIMVARRFAQKLKTKWFAAQNGYSMHVCANMICPHCKTWAIFMLSFANFWFWVFVFLI